MTSLRDFIAKLTPSAYVPQVKDASVGALRIVTEPDSSYIWPNLEEKSGNKSARISLIMAAGAVGKSAAAEAIAARLHWPLINAARAQVGSYSLSGLLHDALGFETSYMAEIASGRAGVVIDALDEAHLRAGTSNFQAFLENVSKLAGDGHENISIVLLSRPDTAEIIKIALEDNAVPFNIAQLSFFNYEQACDFIDSQLTKLAIEHPGRDYTVANKHPQPYRALRDFRMREIAQALLTREVSSAGEVWPQCRCFK